MYTTKTKANLARAALISCLSLCYATYRDIFELVNPYPLEQHTTKTGDGYLLTLFRIPSSPPGLEKRQGGHSLRTNALPKEAVLLQHGLLDSCAGFLLAGQDTALAFLLADEGYDVWLGNVRGSTQSREHAWLDPSSSEYWAFSYDEMAEYDLPAQLQYIRTATRTAKVHYIGHSQGTTIMLAALSSQPHLHGNLGLIVMLAPVALAHHVTSPPLIALAALGTDGVFTMMGVHEFLPSSKVAAWLEGQLCRSRGDLCISLLAALCGYRRGAVNETLLPRYLEYTPAGTSVQNIAHWAQAVRGGNTPGHPSFSYFDYGSDCSTTNRRQGTCNMEQYNRTAPPPYRLTAIDPSVKLSLFTGGQDRMSNSLDVELLLESLPPGVVKSHQYDADLEHLDYIWGIDIRQRVYKKVIQDLKTFGGGGIATSA